MLRGEFCSGGRRGQTVAERLNTHLAVSDKQHLLVGDVFAGQTRSRALDPGVVRGLKTAAPAMVLAQQGSDEVHCEGLVRIYRLGELNFRRHYLFYEVANEIRLKWQPPIDQLIGDNPNRPRVDQFIILLPLEHLRRLILYGPGHRPHLFLKLLLLIVD